MPRPSRTIIHAIAAAGGATAGAMPPLVDIPTLCAEEVAMVIALGKEFGVKLTKSAAAGVLTAAGCTVVATTIFEVANIGYPFTIPIKIGIAVSTIEAAGNLVYDYFDAKYGGGSGSARA